MSKRISETERLIGYGLGATEDALNSAIQSLIAIRNNRFPVEKKTRKTRKPREPKPEKVAPVIASVPTRRKPSKPEVEDLDAPTDRHCVNCDWQGATLFPEPCPECGAKTEAA